MLIMVKFTINVATSLSSIDFCLPRAPHTVRCNYDAALFTSNNYVVINFPITLNIPQITYNQSALPTTGFIIPTVKKITTATYDS
jgi:hypothetical protein